MSLPNSAKSGIALLVGSGGGAGIYYLSSSRETVEEKHDGEAISQREGALVLNDDSVSALPVITVEQEEPDVDTDWESRRAKADFGHSDKWRYRDKTYYYQVLVGGNREFSVDRLNREVLNIVSGNKVKHWCQDKFNLPKDKREEIKKAEYWCFEKPQYMGRIPVNKEFKTSLLDYQLSEDYSGQGFYETLLRDLREQESEIVWLKKAYERKNASYGYTNVSRNWCSSKAYAYRENSDPEWWSVFLDKCLRKKHE